MTTWIKQARQLFGEDPAAERTTILSYKVNAAFIETLDLTEAQKDAVRGALVTRGKRRGLLQRSGSSPAWRALMGWINPGRARQIAMGLLGTPEDRELMAAVDVAIEQHPQGRNWVNGWLQGFHEFQLYPQGRQELCRVESIKWLVDNINAA